MNSGHYQPPENDFQNDKAMMSVGEVLRQTREHYGRTLEDVEEVLRIRLSLLKALEEDDASKLPGRVYAIGFVRSYAEYLGLDGDQIVEMFKQQLGGKTKRPEYHFPVAAEESRKPDLKVFLISIVGLILIFLSYNIFKPEASSVKPSQSLSIEVEDKTEVAVDTVTSSNTASEAPGEVWPPRVEDVMPEMLNAVEEGDGATEGEVEALDAPIEDVENVISDDAESSEEAEAVDTDLIIKIVAKDPTWLQIKDAEGATVFTGILRQGKDIIVPPEAIGWRMDTGNAGGLDIYIGEELLPPLGGNGIVVRRVPLFAEALKSRFP